jgi:hypothetical protein
MKRRTPGTLPEQLGGFGSRKRPVPLQQADQLEPDRVRECAQGFWINKTLDGAVGTLARHRCKHSFAKNTLQANLC